jgi:Ca-activated chloride channel family protein
MSAGLGGSSAAEVGLRLGADAALADPWFLCAVPIGWILIAWGSNRRARPFVELSIPSLGGASGTPPRSARQRAATLVPWVRALALALLGVALARPLRTDVRTTDLTEGVDILAVIDRSSSMLAEDLERGRDRLEVAREVLGEFARRRMTDRVDAADSVGLISFARYPDLVCPITLDTDAFTSFLDTVRHARPNSAEDGTAIGVALAKAVALLGESDAESKVVVLLTDGENGDDTIAPLEAAELAAEREVVVHTVFVGGEGRRGPFGALMRAPDTTELERIAALTGGRFFRAQDRAGLEAVYTQIEELERTPRERVDEIETHDLYPPFLLAGILTYLIGWLGASTLGRRAP